MPSSACKKKITVKTAAELIVNTAAIHSTERVQRHVKSLALAAANVIAKQKTQRDGLFFFNGTATAEIYTLSLHDALPILDGIVRRSGGQEFLQRCDYAVVDQNRA